MLSMASENPTACSLDWLSSAFNPSSSAPWFVTWVVCRHVLRQHPHLHDRQNDDRQQHALDRLLAHTDLERVPGGSERVPGRAPKQHYCPSVIRVVSWKRLGFIDCQLSLRRTTVLKKVLKGK